MDTPFCFDCRFLVPDDRLHNDLTQDDWDDILEGECRASLPALGPVVTDRHGDEYRHYGEWPRVLASFWCGHFQPRPPVFGERTVRTIRLTSRASKVSAAAGSRFAQAGGSNAES